MRVSFILLVLFIGLKAFAQEDDYFQSQETRKQRVQASKLANDRFPHHEKLGLQVFGNGSLIQINDMYGVFESHQPGFGGDAGLGLKVRIFRKLSLILGGTYSSKYWNVEWYGIDPLGMLWLVKEKARTHNLGPYLRFQMDFTRKFWMALHFEYTIPLKFQGIEQTGTINGQVQQWSNPNITTFAGGLSDQFDIGINLGMNFPVLFPVNLRPFAGIQIATIGFVHTGAIGTKLPFMQEGEINPGFLHLKLGVIFDIPLLPVRPASNLRN